MLLRQLRYALGNAVVSLASEVRFTSNLPIIRYGRNVAISQYQRLAFS